MNKVMISSVRGLREFVTERLTAAAEEILGVFVKTVVEYEEEIQRQRRLLDVAWKPEVLLQRIELPRQHGFKEEKVLTKLQLDQQDPEPPEIKDQEQPGPSTQGEQRLGLKQEAETSMLTPADEEGDHSGPEPILGYQLLSAVAENIESGSTSNRGAEPNKRCKKNRNRSDTNFSSGRKDLKCDTCGKTFSIKSQLKTHRRSHTDKRPHVCDTCGKTFKIRSHLESHNSTHSGERPFCCDTCGKSFTLKSNLERHMRIHTGERPYCCHTCGKNFALKLTLERHMRTHTDERPYCCVACGRCFRFKYGLMAHIKIHTGERPSLGKTFS